MDAEINWNDVMKKETRVLNDLDLGEVQGVSDDDVVIQKGLIEKNFYHLLKSRIKSMMEKCFDLIILKVN